MPLRNHCCSLIDLWYVVAPSPSALAHFDCHVLAVSESIVSIVASLNIESFRAAILSAKQMEFLIVVDGMVIIIIAIPNLFIVGRIVNVLYNRALHVLPCPKTAI